jgi:GNAT superfamily N-acetyltransferase
VAISDVARDPLSALRWRETTERSPSELMAVSRFFVRPTSRGEGIGSALLDVATAEIRRRDRLPVLEMTSARREGFPFLLNRGWRLVAIDPWGPKGKHFYICRYAAPWREPA